MTSTLYQYQDIQFEHRVRRGMKHVYIHIHKSGLVILKSPPISTKSAFEAIVRQSDWIYRQLERVQTRAQQQISANHYIYLGHIYPLELQEVTQTKRAKIEFENLQLKGYFPAGQPPEQETISKALEKFYRSKAQAKIPLILTEWAEIMQLWPKEFIIKKQRKRWGSCTSKGKILINYQCIKLPIECIELIMVHELAHLKVPNHSRKFWELVERYLPDYRHRKKMLKEFSLQYSEAFD